MTATSKPLSGILSEIGIDAGTQKLLSGSRSVAGSRVTTEVKGLKELEAALAEMPERLAKKTLVNAVRDATNIFKAFALGFAPYDAAQILGLPKWRTIHLRDGILVKVTKNNYGPGGTARIRGELALDKEHAFFGRYIEFGWIHSGGDGVITGGLRRSTHGSKVVAHGEKQIPPHPFFRPAFEAGKRPALGVFEVQLRAGVEAAAKELRK